MISKIQSNAVPERQRIANTLLAIALAAATLWDYRLFGLRIFDGLALVCLTGFFFVNFEPLNGFFQRRRDYWLMFGTIVAYAALGFILYGHRSSLAIIILGIGGFILIGRRDWLVTALNLRSVGGNSHLTRDIPQRAVHIQQRKDPINKMLTKIPHKHVRIQLYLTIRRTPQSSLPLCLR